MKIAYHDTEVIDIVDETPVVKRYFFKFPDHTKFDFKAGQFVMLDLPIDAKFTNRSYSIASAPSDDNIFELCIVLKPDGKGTPYLFDNVKKGSLVKCTTPLGKFTMPDTIDKDICFIATGTGIAPLRSMLIDIFNKNIPHRNIYMIFGNRKIGDILYRSEMETFEKEHPEFKFFPVLSRETKETWPEKFLGYVHPVYEDLFRDNRQALFYICGWSAMVKEARDKLKERGYTKNELKFELYD
jgi:ferredoxin-NADP reductase